MNLPDELQTKLDDYNKNFEAINTFLGEEALTDASAVAELRAEKTREMLTAVGLPIGATTIIELAQYGASETVRLSAAKYLVDRSLGSDPNLAEEDQATQLLRKIQRVATKTTEGG